LRDPLLVTERSDIFVQNIELIKIVMAYYSENKAHLSPWEPLRDEVYFSEKEVGKRLDSALDSFNSGQSLQLAALDKSHSEIIGLCNFTNIVRGPFQACFLGYSIAASYEGKGMMLEILKPSIDYLFRETGLHRIMANYIPGNVRSGRTLENLGFEIEGLAKSYLKINGKWEDHILTSLISSL